MKKEQLTPQQKLFALEYLIDLNAYQAALRAGYSEKTARARSAEWVPNEDSEKLGKMTPIQQAVRVALNKRAKKLELSGERVLQEYARIAFCDITRTASAVCWSRNSSTMPWMLPDRAAWEC